MRLIVIAATVVMIVLAYLLLAGRRTQCDTIFEQTAARVGGNLDVVKTKGEFFVGREQMQALTDGAQKVGLHLKSCCLSQQTGKMTSDQFQNCINGAKDYESRILLVTNLINEAQVAKDQGNAQLAEQKAGQAREAASAVTSVASDLGKTAANLSSDPISIKGAEQEPNNTILQANTAEMGATISGEISPADDQDFFKFQYKDSKNRRDFLLLHVENRSTTLQPQIQVYNEDKSLLQNWFGANAAGANLDYSFVAEPDKTYYVAVGSSYSGTGKYTLSLVPQKLTINMSRMRMRSLLPRLNWDRRSKPISWMVAIWIGIVSPASQERRSLFIWETSQKPCSRKYGSAMRTSPCSRIGPEPTREERIWRLPSPPNLARTIS